jgi:cytochrome c oxidase subunit 2
VGLQLPKRARRLTGVALVPVLLLLASCSQAQQDEWKRGAMPEAASDRSGAMIEFWQWTWVAALVVGVLVWGLIFYAVIAFRRRSDDEIPVQTRYNLPMEILYTVAPVIVVLVLFDYVVKVQNEVLEEPDPDHVINVVGQKWSWSFNYVEDEALDGQTTVNVVGTPADPPTLVLPVDESVRFDLNSPDVIHSFWVAGFHYKEDVIPGKTNTFTITPTREGSYRGKCAELCGVYHSRMLFDVEIVSAEEYAAYLQDLSENPGNVGLFKGGRAADTQTGLDLDEEAGE